MLEFFFIGFTLVVSPLVSLIEDQVMALRKINVPAEMLNASVEKSEVTRILNDMTNPNSEMRLLYVTPEKLSKSKR
jgi:ATP-dependent DNA helicase Q1